jgi:glycosyltransferase involved in cell wall biosynthesis
LTGQIIILGMVPFSDLINLMRSAAVIIQPSRFEGWSTIVQDAKAIGRPLLCSDIAVHQEQAPESLGFFSCDEPDQLAELLAESWSDLSPGPSPACESHALETERAFARTHGQNLLNVCREACV